MRLWTGAWGPGKSSSDNFDVHASGPFTLLGRKHTAIVGWNGGNQRARSLGGEAEIAYPDFIPDYRSWTGNIPRPVFHADGSRTETVTRLAGAYVATRLSLADPLHLIIGARSSTYRTDTRSYDTRARTRAAPTLRKRAMKSRPTWAPCSTSTGNIRVCQLYSAVQPADEQGPQRQVLAAGNGRQRGAGHQGRIL
jgi:hypothetical protein